MSSVRQIRAQNTEPEIDAQGRFGYKYWAGSGSWYREDIYYPEDDLLENDISIELYHLVMNLRASIEEDKLAIRASTAAIKRKPMTQGEKDRTVAKATHCARSAIPPKQRDTSAIVSEKAFRTVSRVTTPRSSPNNTEVDSGRGQEVIIEAYSNHTPQYQEQFRHHQEHIRQEQFRQEQRQIQEEQLMQQQLLHQQQEQIRLQEQQQQQQQQLQQQEQIRLQEQQRQQQEQIQVEQTRLQESNSSSNSNSIKNSSHKNSTHKKSYHGSENCCKSCER